MKNHHVITIGTSAGGVRALKILVSQLPKDFQGSIYIVQHLSSEAPSNLARVLKLAGQLPVNFAVDREPIEPGRIYLAPPDYHLILKQGYVRVIRGPRENRMRPAIDPLFRSAAVAYRSYVTGVVLTGMLDDGTAGLQAIKACGGMAIVQEPNDAAYSSMPQSAIANVEVDRIVLLKDIPNLLIERVRQTPPPVKEVPADLLIEVPIAVNAITEPDSMAQIGKPVAYSCPSCGGPLWQIGSQTASSKGKPNNLGQSTLHYRCHVGHAFTSRTLIEEQSEATEKALWVALRTLEERSRMLNAMSDRYAQTGAISLAQTHEQRAIEASEHAVLIRDLLRDLKVISEFPEEKTKPEPEAS
ncbi:chemotaxis protein CheB [Pleurocapsales cyanobacterium LEGE 10410]|nr:chemotaxis protein CheB [Pleurocapsales cyanobacterium LEGE 10410]